MMSRFLIWGALSVLLAIHPGGVSAKDSLETKTAKKPRVSKATKAKARKAARLKAAIKKADRAHRRQDLEGLNAARRDISRLDSEHPAIHYYQAVIYAITKQDDMVFLTLSKLKQNASSEHARLLPVYRVRARRSKTFKYLLTNMSFRKIVGIDNDPATPKSAYERLVGLGGAWQDRGLPCERAKVDLDLDVERYKFLLVISSRCQGNEDKTRLRGNWDWEGSNLLKLRFPNAELGMEDLNCELKLCDGDANEDCLRCVPDPELEFNLRPLRR